MGKPFVLVAMRVPQVGRHGLFVRVAMMRIVLVLVGMFQSWVAMKVLVPLAQVQPDSERH